MIKKIFTLIIALITFVSLSIATPDNDKDGKKTETTNTFDVSANTITESVKITFNSNTYVGSVKVIDSNSKIVLETGRSRGSIGSVIDIPIEDMENGTYFIRIETESGIQVQRIIISK